MVGFITQMSRERIQGRLSVMMDAIYHERFYVSGLWSEESLGVYVGWVAKKNSFSDGTPFVNELGDVVLLFSGEEYPDPATVRQLKHRGHVIGPSAGSYLVHLYEV